jgi:hypothetical protein
MLQHTNLVQTKKVFYQKVKVIARAAFEEARDIDYSNSTHSAIRVTIQAI